MRFVHRAQTSMAAVLEASWLGSPGRRVSCDMTILFITPEAPRSRFVYFVWAKDASLQTELQVHCVDTLFLDLGCNILHGKSQWRANFALRNTNSMESKIQNKIIASAY